MASETPQSIDWHQKRGIDFSTRKGRLFAVLLFRLDGHLGRAWHDFDPSVFDRYLEEKVGRRAPQD